MTETKDAERIGTQPTASAAARSARGAPGLGRGVFIGWSRPSVQTTLLASSAGRPPGAPGYDDHARTSSSAAVAVGTVSSSSSQTSSGSWVSARSMPAVNPPAPPVFAVSETTSYRSWSAYDEASSSGVPSVLALSTTTTRLGGRVCASSAASDSSSRSRRFHVTTTATTRVFTRATLPTRQQAEDRSPALLAAYPSE
jgi:hypothetical protein